MGVKRTRGGKLAAPRDPEDPAMRKMFAGNLHSATTQEELKTFFSRFGEVEQCYCAMNKNTGKCKGYGFVTYRLAEAVDAIQSSRPHTLLDREVDTRRAVPRELAGNPESELRSKKLYITGLRGPKSGLNENISDADLREYFGQFGLGRPCHGPRRGRGGTGMLRPLQRTSCGGSGGLICPGFSRPRPRTRVMTRPCSSTKTSVAPSSTVLLLTRCVYGPNHMQ